MSVDLRNKAGAEMCFNNTGWRYLLQFAEVHGFNWPTDASGEDASELTDTQAQAFAGAIHRGLGSGSIAEMAARASAALTDKWVLNSMSSMFRDEPIRLDSRTIEHWLAFVTFSSKSGFAVAM
jgi:hypothetical protein